MLLYITAEDVFGDAAPDPRGPRPPQALPATLPALYDRGMRHHQRRFALARPQGAGLEGDPDWKLDRLVIRIALYCREKLGLEPGSRAVLCGPLGWLWPAAEFAIQGFCAVSVGIEHDLDDEPLAVALQDAEPRVIFTTDAATAARIQRLRTQGLLTQVAHVAAVPGPGSSPEVLSLAAVLEFGGTFDTAERAQAFRMMSRSARPDAEALWHVRAGGSVRLTHAQAMEAVAARQRSHPPALGDVVYLGPPRVTLAERLALFAFVGDGLTETVLGTEGAAREELPRVRPHGLRAGADWLEDACRGQGPRWPGGLDRRRVRRALQGLLGDRLRYVETERLPNDETVAALAAAGVVVNGDVAP